MLEPESTWQSYLQGNHNWQETAVLLTVPLIVASSVGAWILRLVFGGGAFAGGGTSIIDVIMGIVLAAIMLGVAAFVIGFLAGVFNGKNDFDKSLGALSLAAIPGYVGAILMPLPFIGFLLSLAASIYSLVLLYRIIPSYLEVPDDKRIIHFVVSIVGLFCRQFCHRFYSRRWYSRTTSWLIGWSRLVSAGKTCNEAVEVVWVFLAG